MAGVDGEGHQPQVKEGPGMMTEAEAKTKICPIMSVRADGPLSCVGDGCMAWRWQHGVPEGGYCGLVGNPDPMYQFDGDKLTRVA